MKALFVKCAAALLFVSVAHAEESLDDVLAKNYEARGGYETLKSLKSAKMSGKMTLPPGIEAPMLIEFASPNKVRMEFSIQGMTGIQTYDGETGWRLFPFLGQTEAEKVPDGELKDLQDTADLEGPLVDYKEKGHKVTLLGKEDVEGTEAYKIQLEKKNGDQSTIYLDSEYFLEFKQVATVNRQGVDVTVSTILGDYKEVGGLVMPHSIEVQLQDAPAGNQTITIDKIELDIDIDDARFGKPAAISVGG